MCLSAYYIMERLVFTWELYTFSSHQISKVDIYKKTFLIYNMAYINHSINLLNKNNNRRTNTFLM